MLLSINIKICNFQIETSLSEDVSAQPNRHAWPRCYFFLNSECLTYCYHLTKFIFWYFLLVPVGVQPWYQICWLKLQKIVKEESGKRKILLRFPLELLSIQWQGFPKNNHLYFVLECGINVVACTSRTLFHIISPPELHCIYNLNIYWMLHNR